MTASFTWTCEGVSPEKMKVLALLLGDPNPIHIDATRSGIWDSASGW